MRTSLSLLVLCVAVTACGSTAKVATSSSSSTVAPSAQGGSTAATTTTGASGTSSAPVHVCTVLPTAQVASLSGKTLGSSREQDFAGGHSYTCDYDTPSGIGGLSVAVTTVDGAMEFQNSRQVDLASQNVEHVTPVAGLGDKAFSARDGVHALFGDRLIFVAGVASVPRSKAIVQALQAKLP